ncbi:MAG: HAMP domain-containing sensor histidine kinase [Saprospiraceae bacterium]
MQHTIVRWVILFGTVALVGIIGVQIYWVTANWNLNEEEFNNKVHLALYRVAEEFAGIQYTDMPLRDVVNQRSANYYVVNIENEIYAPTLEYLLQREFERLGLHIDFEYGIFDCTTDQMLYGGFCRYSPESDILNHTELGYLPKDNEFTYFFAVKFPGRNGFLLGQMQLALVLSVVLLVTVVFFGFAMFVILRQKRFSDLQKDFINNMTHEFKTPLSTIRIAATVFQRDERVAADQRLTRYADIIHEQYERLNGQVEKVLQLAKVEGGNFDLKREWLDLRDVLDPLLSATQARMDDAAGTLTTTLPPREPLSLHADPLHLSNILHNLIDNAVKYGGEAPRVHVSVARQESGETLLTIEDSGVGIAKEHLGRVFDKFFRVPTGALHEVKGFGLGLFYVRQICRAHGWSIKLDSKPAEGTTVTLKFPKPAAQRRPAAIPQIA